MKDRLLAVTTSHSRCLVLSEGKDLGIYQGLYRGDSSLKSDVSLHIAMLANLE